MWIECIWGGSIESNFFEIQREDIKLVCFTCSIVLHGCSILASMEKGKKIHSHIIKLGFELDVFVGSTLLDMYVESGSIVNARQDFEKMPESNIFSWNAMIIGFAQHGNGPEALHP